jgi:hypothetical protein
MRMRSSCEARITTGVLVCAGFALGTLGSMDCPANYFRIVTEDVCRSAAAAAGLVYQGRVTAFDSPQGCNLYARGVFLNDVTGAGSLDVKVLCSGAPLPLTAVLGPNCKLTWALVGYRSRIGFLFAATASPTPAPTSPGDTNPPTASPTPSPTYSPDGTPCTPCHWSAIPVRPVAHRMDCEMGRAGLHAAIRSSARHRVACSPCAPGLLPVVGRMRTFRHELEPSLC